MEENLKSKLGFSLFVIVVLFLLIGGYFYTKRIINEEPAPKKENVVLENVKIDEEKDYLYYTNEKEISKDADITYKDIVINIKGQEDLTKSLKSENESYKESIKYISDMGIESTEAIPYNYDNLYLLMFRNYEIYEYDNYASLVLKDYSYSCIDLVTFKYPRSYVFDTKTGVIIKEEELLKKYNKTLDEIKSLIRSELEKKQVVEEGVELIKIDETLDNFTHYALYINDLGKLCITYLVKSSEVDYNLSMEVV